MWALGVTLFTMLCAFPPWGADDEAVLHRHILGGEYSFPSPWWDDISAEAKSMVRGLMTVDYERRLTAEDAARHEWLSTSWESC
jgi:serine/threonine protein kinase